MTREELRGHCERQIQQFERIEKIKPVTPNDWKRYEEHKLILELLEQTDGDLISRKDLLKELNKWDWQDAYLPIHFAELVADLPSAEKTAKWINETEETIECGNCHHIFDDFGLLNGDQEKFYEYPNFCPNCGRKMIGVEMKGVEK